MSNPLKQVNDMLDVARVAVGNIKAENKRLREENERLLTIIEQLTKPKNNDTERISDTRAGNGDL